MPPDRRGTLAIGGAERDARQDGGRGVAIPKLTGKVSDRLRVAVAAAGRGDIEAVDWILERKPEWLTRIGSHGRTMLREAAYRGRLRVVAHLADLGADIDACGCHYTPMRIEISPYCAALLKGRNDVADYLRSVGAVYDIHSAAYLGDAKSVDDFLRDDPALLECGNPQAAGVGRDGNRTVMAYVDTPWATPLSYAICGRQPDIARTLLSRGADLMAHHDRLMDQAYKHAGVLRMLLERGADASVLPPARHADDELGKLLAAYGVAVDVDHNAPLVYLCRGDRGGDPENVLALIRQGADLSLRDYKGRTALINATRGGLLPAMRLLLEHGAEVEAPDSEGETPLMHAVRASMRRRERKVAAIELLLSHGADVSAENAKGSTAQSIARRSRRPEKQDMLRILSSMA